MTTDAILAQSPETTNNLCDAARQLAAARDAVRVARIDACLRQAGALIFWADAATSDTESQRFLDERGALLAEAERLLMGGAL